MKIHMKLNICVLLLCLSTNLHAQQMNLFECGKPLTDPEINFKNLFQNFPKYVENSEQIDLLDYKYIGLIENEKQALKYVKKNIHFGAIAWSYSLTTGRPDSTISITLDTGQRFSKRNTPNLKKIVKTIANVYLHPGYKVYLIHYTENLDAREYYIFVNPQTNKVATQGNQFAIPIPFCLPENR